MARSGSGRRGAYRSNRLSLSMAKCGRNSETTRLIASLHDQGKWFTAALSHQFDLPAPDARRWGGLREARDEFDGSQRDEVGDDSR